MTDLLNIAKECGAVIARPDSDTSEVVMSPAQLHATVEKVCGPIIEKAEAVIANLDEGDFISTTRLQELTDAIKDVKKLMGQDK